jgi:hypothetical protein
MKMTKQKFTAHVDNQTCTKTVFENGQENFSCDCSGWQNAMKEGIPCKHICALLFTDGNSKKWEYLVLKYARDYRISSNLNVVHNVLARDLRNPNFNKDDQLSTFALWLKRNKNDFDNNNRSF